MRFLTAGESHGPALTVIVEGLPAGLTVDRAAIDADLKRRQGGYGRGGRMKIESDSVEVLSGIRHGKTLGSPVSLLIRNKDHANWADVMSPDPQPPEAKTRR
ncbi:MAG TPA: chorismate synthase, partial [Vicinamibacteria bacterium]|nr:chorismate synthase [Vicinamibacteria bacterium]